MPGISEPTIGAARQIPGKLASEYASGKDDGLPSNDFRETK